MPQLVDKDLYETILRESILRKIFTLLLNILKGMYGPTIEDSFTLTFWYYKNVPADFNVIISWYMKGRQYNTTKQQWQKGWQTVLFQLFAMHLFAFLINVINK